MIREFARHVELRSLDLTIICHVERESSAERIVRPLLEYLPILKDCAISFSDCFPDGFLYQDLDNLASKTVQALQGQEKVADRFDFFGLPPEIRAVVLENTSLVIPSPHGILPTTAGRMDFEYNRWWRMAKCCRQCTSCLERCCCRSQPASYSSRCTCDGDPIRLFGVSRQFYREAQSIFFSSNTFAFHVPFLDVGYLRSLSRNSLRWIRKVQVILDVALYWKEDKPYPDGPITIVWS